MRQFLVRNAKTIVVPEEEEPHICNRYMSRPLPNVIIVVMAVVASLSLRLIQYLRGLPIEYCPF